jgi:hypothetical protein
MPSNTDLIEDESEATAGLEYAFKDGAKAFDTRPRISSKNGLLTGTFFDPETLPQDLDLITRFEGVPMLRKDFLNFIHKISQKKTDLLAVGIDDRIYRLKVRIGLPKFGELTINSFDYELPIFGYETFWEDVTEKAFYYFQYNLIDGQQFWKYDETVKFYGFNVLKFPLEILEPPYSFNATFHSYVGSNQIWNSSFDSFPLYLDGDTVDYDLDGLLLKANIDSTPLVSKSYTTKTDYLLPNSSFVFETYATTNTDTLSLDQPVDIFTFQDGSPFQSDYDTIDIANFVQDLSNLDTYKITLNTNPSKYLEIDLLPYLQNKTFEILKFKLDQFTNIGTFVGIVNYFTITSKDNGTRVTVKINNIYSAKNFGVGMNYLVDNYTLIHNLTGKSEVKTVTLFDPNATTKTLTINTKAINLTTESVLVVKDNQILAGDSITNLKLLGRFQTMIEEDIIISAQSNLPTQTYYSVTSKYL